MRARRLRTLGAAGLAKVTTEVAPTAAGDVGAIESLSNKTLLLRFQNKY